MLKRCCNRLLLAGLMVIALGGGATAQERPVYLQIPMVVVKGVQYTLPTLRVKLPGYQGGVCGRYISKPLADVRFDFFNLSEVEPVTLNVTIEILGDSYPSASDPVYGRKNFVLTLNKRGAWPGEAFEVPLREDLLAAKWSTLRASVTVTSSRSEPITFWSQPVTVNMDNMGADQSYSSNTVLQFNENNQIREATGCTPPPSPAPVQPLPKPVVTPQPAPSRPLLIQPLPRPVRISPVNPVPLRQAQ